MLTTTKWSFPYPEGSDADDVPTAMQSLADALDVKIVGWSANTWANRPIGADIKDGLIFWATDLGLFYICYNGSLQTVGRPLGTSQDITTIAYGADPGAGGSGRTADAAHRHGAPSNPVTAHNAAADPHTGYLLRLGMTSIDELERLVQRIDTRQLVIAYTGGLVSSIVEKSSDGTTTVKTTTFTYSGTQLTSVAETVGTRVVTTTMAYDGNGNLSGVTRAVV